jgi:hypothetical protein
MFRVGFESPRRDRVKSAPSSPPWAVLPNLRGSRVQHDGVKTAGVDGSRLGSKEQKRFSPTLTRSPRGVAASRFARLLYAAGCSTTAVGSRELPGSCLRSQW